MAQEEKLIELVKSRLPQMLREDEEFRALVLGTLIQYLPTREEIKLILERLERIELELVELRREQIALREDFSKRFERVEAELVELRREQIALREDFNKRFEWVEAELVELRKEQVALREDFNRMQQTIEALQQTIAEMQQTIAAILERLERIESQHAALVEQVESFRASTHSEFGDIRADLKDMRRAFSRLGLLTESVVRETLRAAVENWLGAGRVERMELGGREVDVVIRDAGPVLLEITSRVHLQDIDKLKLSAADYEQRFGIKPRLAIACAYATPSVVQRLMEEDIEVVSADVPE